MKKYEIQDMKKAIFLISILSLLHISCEKDFSDHWPYYSPENINDGFNVGSLEEVNIEAEMIAKAVGRINQGKYKEVHSIKKVILEFLLKLHVDTIVAEI